MPARRCSMRAPGSGCSPRSTATPASSTAVERGDTVTVHEVWIDGVRSDGEAYAEALERVRAADPSEQVALARSVQRLARLTGVRPVSSERLRTPVPDWLADALVRQAGLTRLAVAAMDATTAFDAWNQAQILAIRNAAFQIAALATAVTT